MHENSPAHQSGGYCCPGKNYPDLCFERYPLTELTAAEIFTFPLQEHFIILLNDL